jgi:hypothetical protein
LKDGDFIRFGPREDKYYIVTVERPVEEEEAEEGTAVEEPVANAEKEALDKYLQQQKDKTFKEIYTELIEREKNPFQTKKVERKPEYNRMDVTWGMVDEDIVYADKADEEIIRTDILRLMPNLTPRHLAKIEEFEKKQRKLKMLTVGAGSPRTTTTRLRTWRSPGRSSTRNNRKSRRR